MIQIARRLTECSVLCIVLVLSFGMLVPPQAEALPPPEVPTCVVKESDGCFVIETKVTQDNLPPHLSRETPESVPVFTREANGELCPGITYSCDDTVACEWPGSLRLTEGGWMLSHSIVLSTVRGTQAIVAPWTMREIPTSTHEYRASVDPEAYFEQHVRRRRERAEQSNPVSTALTPNQPSSLLFPRDRVVSTFNAILSAAPGSLDTQVSYAPLRPNTYADTTQVHSVWDYSFVRNALLFNAMDDGETQEQFLYEELPGGFAYQFQSSPTGPVTQSSIVLLPYHLQDIVLSLEARGKDA